ncbi:MAG: hypothetical protein DSM107014_02680 [Gomphosphaeria aponina SAG 52.96 = DSM 107014]|uniref:Uncharacterized protein n=1 Tax=Gomphosphaeria aponina SAG 52.96 = DSM 107014 TaxID=1521640 RepID=A0A941GPS8_9CHRO|nr:hypothetical protein [Gomphosphaeria aponina SAG 52.96 = DSM 107014]
MVRTSTQQPNPSPVLEQFNFEEPYQKLEIMVDIVNGTHNEEPSHRLMNQYALPTPIISALRIKGFFSNRKNRHLRTFEKSVRYNLPFVLAATGTYILFYVYGFEFLTLFWQVFHLTIEWEEVWNGLIQWQVVQLTIISFLHHFLSKLALDSFHINPTFYARYDLLMQEAKTQGEIPINELEALKLLQLKKVELLQDLTRQISTTLITMDDLDPAKLQQIQTLLLNSVEQSIDKLGLSNHPTINISSPDSNPLPPQYHSNNGNLLDDDEDEEYGSNV